MTGTRYFEDAPVIIPEVRLKYSTIRAEAGANGRITKGQDGKGPVRDSWRTPNNHYHEYIKELVQPLLEK